ncbi:MAG TPA: thioredoxin family protein [Desulfobacteraceae bacterium]|nr:thioredoxin family protein [Desulfobacteraceae bacterium]
MRDIKEIGSYGVMGTPALIINGKVKSVGSVPPRSRLKMHATFFQRNSPHEPPSR